MRFSHAAINTVKEAPADADSINARLLTQGGFIHKELAGVYTFLPLGKRVLQKIEKIVREEMNGIHSREVSMPALTPLENWKQTGRDNVDIAFTPTDTTVLGWSHEEIVTPLAQLYIKSWKDLPLSLFQIQTKFRNEPRAKSGVLRGREFLMKDMYSFHATQEDLDDYYQQALEAYLRVYERCGLTSYAIEASGGVFSKNISHEFAVLAEAGEDTVIFEAGTDGTLQNPQNAEIAKGTPPAVSFSPEAELEKKEVTRPKSIVKTAEQYGIAPHEILKTVVFHVTGGNVPDTNPLIGISIRGDLEVNMHKVMQYFGTDQVRPATSVELSTAGLVEGFISPIENTRIPFYADTSVQEMKNFCTGANVKNQDYFQANSERDCAFTAIADFVLVGAGFTSSETGNLLKAENCVEVGNIFDLGDKYSRAFNLRYTDQDGNQQIPLMGCYGIGISRLVGTLVESFHDENGMIWPKAVAPYHVVIIPLGKPGTPDYEQSLGEAQTLEKNLEAKGMEVLLDDREESPGKRFADADLIGIPLRLVISPRTLKNNAVEWKERNQSESQEIPLDQTEEKILSWWNE